VVFGFLFARLGSLGNSAPGRKGKGTSERNGMRVGIFSEGGEREVGVIILESIRGVLSEKDRIISLQRKPGKKGGFATPYSRGKD